MTCTSLVGVFDVGHLGVACATWNAANERAY